MAFYIFTTHRISCFRQHDRINDLIPRDLCRNKCRPLGSSRYVNFTFLPSSSVVSHSCSAIAVPSRGKSNHNDADPISSLLRQPLPCPLRFFLRFELLRQHFGLTLDVLVQNPTHRDFHRDFIVQGGQWGCEDVRGRKRQLLCLISSIKGEVKKKHISSGWNFSCFAAHLMEQDLF
jgi:hypothetical protein